MVVTLFLLLVLCLVTIPLLHGLTDEELRDKLGEMEKQMAALKSALRGSSTTDSTPSTPSATANPFWNSASLPAPRVFLYTFMDKPNDYGCASVRSAILSRTNVTIFGLSDTLHRANGDRYHGFRDKGNKIKKVFILHRYLELAADELHADDIIVFNDGLDVLYTQSVSKVVDRFLSVEAPDTALFAAERTCFPKECKEPADSENAGTFKYVNSGDWIARYDVALRLLRVWTEVMLFEGPEAEDQTAVHEMILGEGHNPSKKTTFGLADVVAAVKKKHSAAPAFEPAKIALDHHCVVFQTGFKTKLSDGTWQTPEAAGQPKGPYLRPDDGVIYNTETSTAALFVHFNGERSWFKPVEELVMTKYTPSDDRHALACRFYLELYPALKECTALLQLPEDFCHLL